MKLTKKWMAILLCFCVICSAVSIGAAVFALPSDEELPIHYELYSYYEDVNKAVSNKTSVQSSSPWSVAFKIDDQWTAGDTFSKSYKSKYIYAWVNGHKVSYYPSFAYYYPGTYIEGDPLYHSLIAPSNVSGDTTQQYKIDMSYQFDAVYSGTYSFGKSDQSLIYSEKSNYFSQENKTQQIDFGVRITVNDQVIWPTADLPYYSEGWAVFGTKNASVEQIEIPTLTNLNLSRGDVFRIEYTSFTPAAVTTLAAQQITGCFRVTMTEIDNDASFVELKNRYEIYDYFESIRDHYENGKDFINTSPWSAACYFDGEWHEPTDFSNDSEYIYGRCTERNQWGLAYPGFGFYSIKNGPRYQRALISPANHSTNSAYVCDSAFVFKAPEKGTYMLHYSDPDSSVSFADTQYFSAKSLLYTGIKFGVRITLNDEVIWPDASYYSAPMEGTYATFGYEISGIPTSVPVPKLENLGMQKGDIVRVEVTSFTPISGEPWNQFVSCGLSMTKVSSEIIKDETAPVFTDGIISLKQAGSSYLSLLWPFATDDTCSSDQLSYTLFISETPYTEASALEARGGDSVSSEGGTVMKLKSDTDYYAAVVCGDSSHNKAVLLGGPFRTGVGEAHGKEIFEVYDYLDEIARQIQYDQQKISIKPTSSPWVAQYRDSTWINLTRATRLSDLIYCNVDSPNWGGYYPGISYISPMMTTLQRCHARLNPAKAAAATNANFDYDAGFAFVAPYAGKYTFEKGNSEFAYSAIFDGKFAVADGASRDLNLGVRITVNDETVWPLENTDCTQMDGYAVIRGYGTDAGSVDIPTLKNIPMIAGDVLRVEAHAFDGSVADPWQQQVSANVRMVLESKTVDTEPPVFSNGSIKSTAATQTSITVSWPLATDALSNAQSIVYKLYYDEQPIDTNALDSLESISVKGTSQRITLLETGKEYYFALVATDIAGNSSFLTSGPFKTLSKGTSQDNGNEKENTELTIPKSPLKPNIAESECGIVSSGGGTVSVGWINSNSMSYYYAFLYSASNGSYTLIQNSGNLGANATNCTFKNISAGNYAIQVIGYNNRGEIFEIFPVLEFSQSQQGTASTPNNNTNVGSSLKPGNTVGDSGSTTTFIDEEGITQVQDVYETVTNARTTTNGPSIAEQILWIALLVFGGIMLIVTGFLTFLLFKKPKLGAA